MLNVYMTKCRYWQSKTQLNKVVDNVYYKDYMFRPLSWAIFRSCFVFTGELYKVAFYISVKSNEISWNRIFTNSFAGYSYRVVDRWVEGVSCGVRWNSRFVGRGVFSGFMGCFCNVCGYCVVCVCLS